MADDNQAPLEFVFVVFLGMFRAEERLLRTTPFEAYASHIMTFLDVPETKKSD